MAELIDRGRSILNATDEVANPYGLILSEEERDYIYARLNTIEHYTNSLRDERSGWRPQLKSALISAYELAIVVLVVWILGSHASIIFKLTVFVVTFSFLILQKVNLLLTHETIEQADVRRDREDKKEAADRERYFKDMRCKDIG